LEFIKQGHQPFVSVEELLVASFVASRPSGIWLEGFLDPGESGSYVEVIEIPTPTPCSIMRGTTALEHR
jgi:hypothetical protein